ncbi:ABC transporter substrate-binding protein [Magnetospirillum sp. 64-120]|uniref:ABC transporter substrate-binding protein n=1 Tax=Magnetospirillum sp. 64-120 TaxID=1895778 RepID=UPI000928205F|nr:ABC transporter substrate-binding protein [Magnetospirillum sp. 64-120]OJX75168.1 MAG: iron ABC transporter substrate-binding protein [Magnetospirillum sp. 64-120]
MARLVLALAALILTLSPLEPASAGPALVDLAGRSITPPDKVERVILGEGRAVSVMAILDRQAPLSRVVGMMGDFPLLDAAGHAKWRQRFPALDHIAVLGKVAADSFSVEKAISLKPDLAIFSMAGHGPAPKDAEIIRQLEAAGVVVVFVDFFFDPLVNTPKSMELLGVLLDRRTQAAQFNDFYTTQLAKVSSRLEQAKTRPLVFIENRVGLQPDCCASIGDGILGKMVEAAGGRNLARDLIPGYAGQISLEYLLTHQPDIYLGTAVGNLETAVKAPERIVMGHDVPAGQAADSLGQTLKRPGISSLAAVRQGRAHALWHHFVHSPFNVVAVQAMAKWFHPALFADLDPQATLRDMTRLFQPMELAGTFWTDTP